MESHLIAIVIKKCGSLENEPLLHFTGTTVPVEGNLCTSLTNRFKASLNAINTCCSKYDLICTLLLQCVANLPTTSGSHFFYSKLSELILPPRNQLFDATDIESFTKLKPTTREYCVTPVRHSRIAR